MPAWLGLINLLGVGLIVAITLAAFHTAWSLTHPPRRTYAWAVARRVPGDPGELDPPRSYEAFTFRGCRTDLPAWRVPGDNPDGPTVVLTHGWGSSRVGGLKRLDPVLPHAKQAILWDLPGHGESPGSARMGTDEHRDLLALLDTLGNGPIVLFGWSLGAGVSIRAAAEDAGEHDIRAVVCEAPYIYPLTPARNVIRLRGMPYRVNLPLAMGGIGVRLGVGPHWAGFARDRHAAKLGQIPLTVIHGDADPVCPIADGQAIADAAPNGRLIVIPGGGHNNLWTDPQFREPAAKAIADAVRAASAAPYHPA
ncbi:MAG: alpha/beta hydrolase [Planctomycetota bacterium]|nr:MAG: alpha/beta hydrolase [Planctomycetota bacterium]